MITDDEHAHALVFFLKLEGLFVHNEFQLPIHKLDTELINIKETKKG